VAVEHLRVSLEGSVVRVRLNRPEKRNALTAEMWTTLEQGLSRFAQDSEARALVIEGEGGCFTAGADLASVRDADGSLSSSFHESAFRALDALRAFPRPSVAVIDGACVGAGISLAMSCDVRVASPSAVLAVPAVSLGIVYEEWAVRRLVELMGSGAATRFLLTGQRLSGTQGHAAGLVDSCVADPVADAAQFLDAVVAGDAEAISATRSVIHAAVGWR
jgi:enoyl-CoA hydratase/carnithine racemase